jgi:hypothetical protein
MKTYKFKCNQCGYDYILIGNSFEYDRVCDMCGGEMILQDEEKVENGEDLIDRLITEQIRAEINENGHTRCWEIIEAINKAETRARYRKYFLLAGGIIPEPRPIIFKDEKENFYFRED